MQKIKRFLFICFLSVATCWVLVANSTPTISYPVTATSEQSSLNQPLMIDLHEVVSSILIAQDMPAASAQRYVAVLTKTSVVPATPSTSAFGAAGAVLVGDRLIVRGDFSNLTSPLRDYATDPLDPPNPNITSGVHIHQGEPTVNGPFQYALTVTSEANALNGRFMGEYPLTTEQMQALSEGKLYVDLHTKRNRAGELRGIFQPY
jgi:hypothetical protein